MAPFDNSILIENVFDEQALIASRQWQELQQGVFISPIYDYPNGPRAAFLHYLPGASVPMHTHRGLEHILILHGSQRDGDRIYTKGALIIHNLDTQHDIVSSEGCLALGIWEKAVEFNKTNVL